MMPLVKLGALTLEPDLEMDQLSRMEKKKRQAKARQRKCGVEAAQLLTTYWNLQTRGRPSSRTRVLYIVGALRRRDNLPL